MADGTFSLDELFPTLASDDSDFFLVDVLGAGATSSPFFLDGLAERREKIFPTYFVYPWDDLQCNSTSESPITVMPGILNLPLEILDLIIDELAPQYDDEDRVKDEDDHDSALDDLRSSALACRAFYNRASFHLFYRIEISQETGVINHMYLVKRVENLYGVLTNNQRLASRIKIMKLNTYMVSSDFDSVLNGFNQHLPFILSNLSSITHFAWQNNQHELSYKYLSPGVLKGLEILARRPSLVSLEFSGMEEFDLLLLLHCKRLRELQLNDISGPDTQAISEKISTAPNLILFQDYGAPQITLAFISSSPMSFSRLHTLRVWMRNPEEVSAAWAVMQYASQTLKKLTIDDLAQGRDPKPVIGPVDLCALVKLQYLRVRCKTSFRYRSILSMGIVGLLNPGKPHQNIQEIEIVTDWVLSQSQVFLLETWLLEFKSDLEGFEAPFSNPTTFPSLKTVSLNLWLGLRWSQHTWSAYPLMKDFDRLQNTWQYVASEPFKGTRDWLEIQPSFDMKLYTIANQSH